MTREEMIKQRASFLKQMHQHIIDLGDEFIYEEWITLAVPDEPDEEIFEEIATDDGDWVDACILFASLLPLM